MATNKVNPLNIGLILGILIMLYLFMRKFLGVDAQTGSAYGTLSVGASISSAQAIDFANKLYSAKGWFDDDEELAYSVFQQLNNKQDVFLIGKKMLALHGDTLEEWMQTINTSPYSYNDGTKDAINQILVQRNIDFQF